LLSQNLKSSFSLFRLISYTVLIDYKSQTPPLNILRGSSVEFESFDSMDLP